MKIQITLKIIILAPIAALGGVVGSYVCLKHNSNLNSFYTIHRPGHDHMLAYISAGSALGCLSLLWYETTSWKPNLLSD